MNEETGEFDVVDNSEETVGGMITDVQRKSTRSNQTMAIATISDMYGSMEVVAFPRDYEKNRTVLVPDEKVLITGRVSWDEQRGAKLIVSKVQRLEEVPRKLWIRFKNREAYDKAENDLINLLKSSDGKSSVVIYLDEEKQMKAFPKNLTVDLSGELYEKLIAIYGDEQIKVTY